MCINVIEANVSFASRFIQYSTVLLYCTGYPGTYRYPGAGTGYSKFNQ